MNDTLFELPEPQETQAQRVKRENGIWVHLSKESEPPWSAWLMPHIKTDQEFGEEISRMCCSYDEGGRVGYGDTEKDAIFDLCRKQNIPCVL